MKCSIFSPSCFPLLALAFLLAGLSTVRAGNAIEADLAVGYAATYVSSVGGEANAQVIIANAVAGNNVVNDQSGTGTRMRIVGFCQSSNDVTGWTTTGGIISYLSGNTSLSDVVSYGSTVGADLVLYICQNTDYSSIAGVSQQPGYYSAINPSSLWYVILAHETGGHCYGRAHNDGVPSPKTIMLHNYCSTGGATPPYFYSNPNIWFNGVQLLGDVSNNCSMGSLVNGGDNSSCGAQTIADRRTRVVTAPHLNNVIYHWMFTNAPGSAAAGTTNFDLVAGAPAIVRGTGAVYTAKSLRLPGGTTGNVAMNAMSAYIDLPNNILSTQTNITIEIWATPLSAPSWARLMDFGRTTQTGDGLGATGEYTGSTSAAAPGTTSSTNGIMLSVCTNSAITAQRFEARCNGVTATLDSGLATTTNVQHHYAVTFTDSAGSAGTNGGRWQWYRDGDPVAFLDVTNHLSAMQDVNNWLGRSQYSADNNANSDYAEVRISSVALARAEVLANYLLGPNYISSATVTLTNSDASSATSFNAAGQWSNGAAPSSTNNYETYDFTLGTPASGSSCVFGGNALEISGGSLLWQGTASSTITVTNLTLNGGMVRNAGSGACTLAGNIAVTTNGAIVNAVSGAVTVSASMNSNGPLTCLGSYATTLSGTNSGFTGRIFVGNGQPGVLTIDSPARLGTSPTNFVADQLDLNRGTLQTTATMALSDPNRGILLDISGGTFNVATNTVLTVSSTLSSPAGPSGYTVVEGSLAKTGAGALVLNSPTNAFKGTLYADTASTSANDGVVKVTNNLVLASAHSPIYIRNNNAGSSTLQLDGTAGNIALPQAVSLNGRTVSSVAIENVAGTNTIAGGLTINVGGSYYLLQSDAGILNLGGAISSAASGSRTITLQGAGNLAIAAAIADGSATLSLAKTGAGTATLSGNNTYGGSTTVSQGTLKLQPSGAVLHLTFDNAAGSSSGSVITNTGSGGSAFNGAIVGTGATIVSGGKFGNALSLNGAGTNTLTNVVYIASKVLDTSTNASWSVGYWIKTTTAGAVIMYQGNGAWSSSGQTTYLLNGNSSSTAGTKAGAVRWAGGFLTGTTALNDGAWHFITLVDSAGAETIYVDGTNDTVTSSMLLALASSANQTWIGGSPDYDAGAVKINGTIDELYMFNRALSQTEVRSLYANNTLSSTNVPILPVTTSVSVASGATFDLGGVSQTVASLSGAGLVTNTGSTTATLTLSNSTGSVTFSGSLGDSSSAGALNLIQAGGATNILSGASSYRGTTAVNGGALFVNGASGSGATTVASGALLAGTGAIGGALTVQSGGTLSPGNNGIGKLTVTGGVTLQTGSTTFMEINKSAAAKDQLSVGGTLTCGGTLVVTNLGGTLVAGDAFQLFPAAGCSGSFAATNLPSLGTNLVWNFNATNGTLAVRVGAAAPRMSRVSLLGANLVLSGSGGAAWSAYSLLGATNLTVPLTNWGLIQTGAFDSAGGFVLTNGMDSLLPGQFYELRIP